MIYVGYRSIRLHITLSQKTFSDSWHWYNKNPTGSKYETVGKLGWV